MLLIKCPRSHIAEHEYIFHIIFKEFFDIDFNIVFGQTRDIRICLDNKTLVVNDTFFSYDDEKWLQVETLPNQPLQQWDSNQLRLPVQLVSSQVPVIYGLPLVDLGKDTAHIGIDIFGSVFFMLSRYEEVIKLDRDLHDRFPANGSLAYQEGFLDRPIVNEYVEILWACMTFLWPSLQRKKRQFEMRVTADVDYPYSSGIRNPVHQFKQIGADIIVRRDPIRAVNNVLNYVVSKTGNFRYDSYVKSFHWMMDINEKAGNRILFYFMSGRSDENFDGCYSLDEQVVRKIMRSIHCRGHEIGLHPSYNTYTSLPQMRTEADTLRRIMDEEKINHALIESRQHYLRWQTPVTANLLESCEIKYDSTLYYAEHPGFRSGTCFTYPFYDVIQRKKTNLEIVPLHVMETTFFSSNYKFFNSKNMADISNSIKYKCKLFNGVFTLLWHNSSFDTCEKRRIYENICNFES